MCARPLDPASTGLLGRLRGLGRTAAGSSFLQSLGVLAGGTAAAQIVIVAASPVLSRLYRPDDFGAFAVWSSLLFTLLQVSGLRYDAAIVLPEEEQQAVDLLGLAALAATGFCAALALAAPWAGPPLVAWTGTPQLAPYLLWLPASLWAAALFQALQQWSIRRRAFRALARAGIGQNVLRVALQIAAGLLRAGTAGLLLGDVLGRFLGTGSLAATLRGRGLRRPAWAGMRAAALRYRRFPLVASGSGLLNQAVMQLPPLLLAGLYGPQVAGWYALGQRVIQLPMVMVGHSITHVYVERAARHVREGVPGVTRLLVRTALLLLAVGIVPFGLLAVFGPWLFARVFGPAWEETGHYARLLAGLSLVELVVLPLSYTLAVLERQGVQLAWDAVRLALLVGGLAAAAHAGLPAAAAIAWMGALLAAAYLGLFVTVLRTARTMETGERDRQSGGPGPDGRA